METIYKRVSETKNASYQISLDYDNKFSADTQASW